MRVVFLGSGSFAIPSFEALLESGHTIAALVTQPDREKGRGRTLGAPPIKPLAIDRGIPVLQPPRIRQDEEALKRLAPDIHVVVAYGQILPHSILSIPPRGNVNVHASLLPRYRGAAPVPWAILGGETETGVTTMLLDEGLDTGPILLQEKTPIGPEETAGALLQRLAPVGGALLVRTLDRLEQGGLEPEPQTGSLATLAPILHKEEGRLSWSDTSDALVRRVRAFDPWPGTTARFRGTGLKILRARDAGAGTGAPGTILAVSPKLVVACGGGTLLEIVDVQPESRRSMSAADFARGARLVAGERLE